MGMLGTHSSFRNHLATDSGHWNLNETVPRIYSSLNVRDNSLKTPWEVYKYYMVS
jgi:hypothetical protein